MSPEKYLLSLKKFSLETELDIESSVQYTRDFSHHGPDFLFAVAELLMNVGVGRYLIYPKSYLENFFEDISSIAIAISSPPSAQNLEAIIHCGQPIRIVWMPILLRSTTRLILRNSLSCRCLKVDLGTWQFTNMRIPQ